MKTSFLSTYWIRITFCLAFICGCTLLDAQVTIKGYLYDATSKEPIPFANIWLVNTAIGTTSNEQGKFELFIASDGELRISHINYQEKILEVKIQEVRAELNIGMQARSITVDEVVVTGKAKEEVVQSELTSIVDYIPFDSLFLVIDTKNSFKGNQISLLTGFGNVLSTVSIPKGRGIRELIQSCNGALYALSDRYAYPIDVFGLQIEVKDRLPLTTFDTYIRPCRTRYKKSLYYLTVAKNGLLNVLKHYDVGSGKITLLAIMGDMELISNYDMDVWQIQRGTQIHTMEARNYTENQTLRAIQEDAAFLQEIYHKPKYPNFVFTDESYTYLMDHFNGEILTYQDTQLIDAVKVNYIKKHRWEKLMLMDPVTEKIYGIFSRKGRLVLRTIDPRSGKSEFSAKLNCPIEFIHSIKIYNDKIYYLEDSSNGKRRLRYQMNS